jgi:hypothetical protein
MYLRFHGHTPQQAEPVCPQSNSDNDSVHCNLDAILWEIVRQS